MGIIRNARRLLAATVLAAFAVSAGAADTGLDVDGDGQQDALTDGMLVLRYLFGYRGETLVEGAVAEGCSRCDTQAIVAFLDQWSKGGGSCGYLPDLVISGVTGPGTAEVGNQVTLAAEVVNRGECKAPPFIVGFRLAADEAGEHSVPLPGVACEMPDGLSVSESIQCQAQWTVPVASVEGDFWLKAVADSGFDVIESNESNNTGVGGSPISVQDNREPDLIVTEVAAPAQGEVGGKVAVSAVARNQGGVAAGAFKLGFLFSEDATIDLQDIRSPSVCSFEGLAANATTLCNGDATVPISLVGGRSYYVGAFVDLNQEVAEASEANNGLAATQRIAIADNRLPDLVVNSVSAPSSGRPGGSIDISLEIANQGDLAAGAFRVGFYFSTDQTITTADAKGTGSCNYENGLAAGVTGTCNGPITVPQTLSAGARYYFGAYVDDAVQVAESNEGNNAASAGTIDMEGGSGAGSICVYNVGSNTTFIRVDIGNHQYDTEIDYNEHACFTGYAAGQYRVGARVYWFGGYDYVEQTVSHNGGTTNVYLDF